MKAFLTPLMCTLLAGPAFAQEPPKPDQEKRIQDLERKLDILSKQLEAQSTGTQMEAPDQGRFGLGASASKVYDTKGGLSIGGYGEVLYTNTRSKLLPDGSTLPSTAQTDALRAVLYMGYKFNDWIVLNTELEWEHGGYSDRSTDGEAILEFAYLDFLVNRAFNVRAGLLLMPMGFVNELHEPPSRLGARRPFLENEGGIIPTTWRENGVGIHGDLGHGLTYRLFAVNGLDGIGRDADHGFNAEGITGAVQLGKQAQANKLALTGRLDWTFTPGALVGGSFYRGNSNQGGNDTIPDTGVPLDTSIAEVHGEYRARGWQVRAIYAQTSISKAGVEALPAASVLREVGTNQAGGYLEVGYDLLSSGGTRQSLIPFVRYEQLKLQKQVAAGVVADPANDRTYLTFGMDYKPIPQVVVKADYTKADNKAKTAQDQFNLGIGYNF
ncbi:hypothetical protein GETHLI_15800 [Geothrix limicola]|uniref:Porin n=1 Tax=Geothrix limicola TaxID=2927978 RepID=A0ABQ5QFE1_9BACT|nr:hypothetical protein [Geothrix limicola]GLH73078.1 hypothetical protein GETHLI_15800 [Geothrix limicola]